MSDSDVRADSALTLASVPRTIPVVTHPDSTAIDLRSDTVTKPTAAMREAMVNAEVGDDVFGEDPTVRALERKIAELLGKEDALFVPSGTQANQISLMLHCQPGDAIFAPQNAHCGLYESGALGAFVGAQIHAMATPLPGPDDLKPLLFPDVYYYPRPRLVTLENTHNHAGGLVFPQERAEALSAFAREKGLGVHLDGARLWNAHVASGVPLAQLASVADTVSICFSKGLGAPVGSALAFPKERRADAMRFRRRMGGALRQAGILAAAALHAIEHHLGDLGQDHWRAKQLAAALEPLGADPERTETNIVVFPHEDAAAFVARAAEVGVKLSAMGPRVVRLTTHRDLTESSIEVAIERLRGLA